MLVFPAERAESHGLAFAHCVREVSCSHGAGGERGERDDGGDDERDQRGAPRGADEALGSRLPCRRGGEGGGGELQAQRTRQQAQHGVLRGDGGVCDKHDERASGCDSKRLHPKLEQQRPDEHPAADAEHACCDTRAETQRGHGERGCARPPERRGARLGVFLDFKKAIGEKGKADIEGKYGNLFDMYQHITGENPYVVPMRIYPAVHYTMGGLWVDYNLMSTIPGLHVLGEANFSDHGANRLGASALMQGLADGYFVIPYTIGNYLASTKLEKVATSHEAFKATEDSCRSRISKLLAVKGSRTVGSFHRELGKIMWDKCGMTRVRQGLQEAIKKIPKLREEFWSDVKIIGGNEELNQSIERAGRVADFLEFGELMCMDALAREESCGGHFRTEFQTPDGEALRDDEKFCHVALWEHEGQPEGPATGHKRHEEALVYENVKLATRSYK